MAKDIMGKVAIYAFLAGIVIALLCGLYQFWTIEQTPLTPFFTTETGGIVAWLLVVIGAIVGLLGFFGKGTITKQEVPGFLTAGIALLVMYGVFSWVAIPYYIGNLLKGVSLSIAIFIAPAVAILAIKAIWDMGKDV